MEKAVKKGWKKPIILVELPIEKTLGVSSGGPDSSSGGLKAS
jgi:hypothetical protein